MTQCKKVEKSKASSGMGELICEPETTCNENN